MSDPEDEETYTNANRAFLQAFLARSTLTFEEAQPILAAIFTAHELRPTLPADITETHFQSHIHAANTKLSPLDLEIRSTLHQHTRQRVHALVNCASDSITQLATSRTPDEMGFMKRVLDAMFETNNTARRELLAVTEIQAVQLHNAPKGRARESGGEEGEGAAAGGGGITMAQAEKVMKGLVEEGWFERSRRGYYTLSARGLMELRGWLMETYNDDGEEEGNESGDGGGKALRVKLCYACKEIVTIGQRCPKRTCHCRLHDICTQNLFRVQKSKKCPLCKVDWTGDDFVGERAALANNSSAQRPSRRGLNGHANQFVAAEASASEGDEGEEEEAQEEDDEDG